MKQRLLSRGPFARGVAVLASGTVFSQGLVFLASPLLTRLYKPEDFGLLAVFIALMSLISVIAGLRYEIALPLPESDADAISLGILALLSVGVVTTLTTLAVLVFPDQITRFSNEPNLGEFLWMLPVGVFVAGAYSVFQYWAIREKAYGYIARTRIEQVVGGVGTQLLLGLANLGALGLVIGQVINAGAGVIGLARRIAKAGKKEVRQVTVDALRRQAIEYKRFPTYSTLEALLNTAGIQLPVILIAGLVGGVEVGCFLLGMRILQVPMVLVGTSISQVFFSTAVDKHRSGELGQFTGNTIKKLFLIGILPMAVLGFAAPLTFGYIFGSEWVRAGQLVSWMAPYFFLQFLASPVSMALHVLGRQALAFRLQLFGLIVRVSAIYVFRMAPIESFAMGSALFYLVYLIAVLTIVHRIDRPKTS